MTAMRAPFVSQKRLAKSRIKQACFQVQALESRICLSVSLSNSVWTPIGPAGLNNGSSGRVTALAADPSNPNILYAGAAGGGVWKTVDGGNAWVPLTDSQTTLSTGAIAVAPNNTNVIYVGTGEADNSPLAYYGRGILVSTNGGASWTLTGNTGTPNFNQKTISQIAVDPTNSQIAYAAVTAVGQNTTAGGTGIFKTTNGGTTWTNTTATISTTAPFTDIKVDPNNSQHLLAAVGGLATQSGIYVSTNGGTSWVAQGGGLPTGTSLNWTRIAFAPSNSQDIYATFANATGSLASAWISTNGGTNWTQLTATPNFLNGQGNYASTLIVDPRNPNIVYAGGGSGTNSFIETTNSGASWTDISTAISGQSPHNMHHAITVDATGRVIDGNDGGVWRLDNSIPGAQAWTNITSNLQIGQMLGGALDPTNVNNAFAGNQGNAVNQFTGGLVWTARDSSDSGPVKIDSATSPLTVYRQVPSTSSFGTAGIFRKSTDGGVTWANATTGITLTDPQTTYDPFVVDPTNNNRVLFGTNRVYESINAGGAWTPISTTNLNGWTTTSAIVALAVAPSATSTIYASAGGHLFVTTNDGAAWTKTAIDPTSPVTTLLVDPSNSLICYGLTSTFGTPHILKTTDGGVTWNSINGNFPDLPSYSIALNGGTIYVGSDNGVYATTNGGTSWALFGTALPNVQVRDLQYNSTSNTLAAFTLGRGVFEISTSLPNTVVVNTATDETTPSDGLISLREAVTQLSGTGGTITFDPTLAGQTLTLLPAIGNISIPNNVNIIGLANRPTIAAGTGASVEIASGATVNLSNLIISGAGTVLQVDSSSQPQLSNVTITGNLTLNGALTLNQVANDTLTGNITGSGSLAKIGSQTLTLVGSNSYTGGTFVSGGTLLGNTNALVNIWTVNAPGIIAIDESTLPGASGTFNGAISGTGTVHITGSGATLTLSSSATIGSTVALGVDASDILVTSATNNLNNSAATLWLGGTLNLGGFSQSVGGLSGGPSALVYNVTALPSPTATLTVGGDNRYSVFAGLLENVPVGSPNPGILAIQKTLPGILTLPTSNTFTGGLTLSGGTLNLNNSTAVGTGRLTLSGGTLDNNTLGALTLTNNNPETWSGNFTFTGTAPLNLGTGAATMTVSPIVTVNNSTLTVPGVISGALNLTKSGPGNLLLSGANTYTGGTTINAGTLTGNTTSLQGGFADGSVLVFDQSINSITDGTFTGNVTGFGAITFANGTVRLASSSLLRNFGATTVLGKLVAPASGGLNALSNISSYDVEGTLDLGASSQTIASLFGAGTIYHFAPAGQSALATLTLGSDDSSTVFTGTILDTQPASGNGGIIAINKLGQGVFTLTGANTFTGGLTVSAGTLGVGPSPASSDPMGAGTLTLNGGDIVLNGRLGATTQQIVPATGYNQDLVVEAPTLPANAVSVTTTTVDSTYVWYEKGYNSQSTTGFPVGAAAFTSATNPAVSFQLQPYNANNVAFIPGSAGSVQMTLATPTAFSTINVLAASANGNAGLVAQLNFADGSSVFTQFAVTDWFNTTVTNTAYTAGGRAARSTGVVTLTPNQARLFEYDLAIPATSQNKLLTSINFTEASGSQVGIYGLSGAVMTVPAVQSYPNAVQILSPANIDVEGSLSASLGNLSIAATQLTLTGPANSSLAFGPTTLTGNATFNSDTGTSLSLGAVNETSGPRNLTKIGPGTLTLTAADSYTGTTTVSAGNLIANVAGALPTNRPVSIGAAGTITLAQSSPSFSTTTGLISIADGGTLNISNNTLFINYGAPASDPITQVRQQLLNGYNAGSWTGAASASSGVIRSSTAASTPHTGIGYADSATAPTINTTPNTVELRYTLVGDLNLDRAVNITDVNALVPHYNSTGDWTGGDFNYDGLVNITDVNALVPNYNTTLPSISPALSPQISPASQSQPAVSASTLFAPDTSNTEQSPRHPSRRKKLNV